ncbi:unnamed protein product [Zymoseptoria tritici ST99CH_1E4]|uniref:Prolyl 4-hydroxylase alpha subunit domain-containing protein n=1 Tax=Zymoseptoria tritici ST99CH_1E4 TaxID=1276532 RepID=A0A2H1FJP5_ZYMTR|nr:unnamed protein product [Zymoseptoria tritici ST99CH_1E4]
MSTLPRSLPTGFLLHQSPNLQTTRIDFAQTPLTEYAGLYAVVIDNVLTPTECATLIAGAEASSNGQWERALVNVGGGRQERIDYIRSCSRIIWDQAEVAERIWKRVEDVPEVKEIMRLEDCPKMFGNGPVKRGEVWRFSRPNERMRVLKYVGGEYFKRHTDGSYATPDGSERSYFTLHLYLNSGGVPGEEEVPEIATFQFAAGSGSTAPAQLDGSALVGGATSFHSLSFEDEMDVHVRPRTGRVLIFQHRNLLHSGQDVEKGEKYTMRTDLMYALESTKSKTRSHMAGLDD